MNAELVGEYFSDSTYTSLPRIEGGPSESGPEAKLEDGTKRGRTVALGGTNYIVTI